MVAWMMCRESPPSLAMHWLPMGGPEGHQLTIKCWCKPTVINEDSRSTVMHHDTEGQA